VAYLMMMTTMTIMMIRASNIICVMTAAMRVSGSAKGGKIEVTHLQDSLSMLTREMTGVYCEDKKHMVYESQTEERINKVMWYIQHPMSFEGLKR
jgi:hypothetical protein